MTPMSLLREDLRDFAGYRSARTEAASGDCWLNANEAASASAADPVGACRRYPEPQPGALRQALAQLYGCADPALLVTRGSDEAIDLLVRAACRPGDDAVVVTPPVFGMYAVCARLHGVRVVEVPLREGAVDFEADLDAVGGAALASAAKLVFLCSPGNPAGGVLAAASVLALAERLRGRALVVVDEAYVEFAGTPSLAPLVAKECNLAVLRTLSKAHALAGARIGCVVADPALVSALRRCQAPYPVPEPSARVALAALAPSALAATDGRVLATRHARDVLATRLRRLPGIVRVHPACANFLLVRCVDADASLERLAAVGIVVRDMRAMPGLGDALRITVGTLRDVAAVADALDVAERVA